MGIIIYLIIGLLFDIIVTIPTFKIIYKIDSSIIPLHSIILLGITTPFIYPIIIIISIISAIKYHKEKNKWNYLKYIWP